MPKQPSLVNASLLKVGKLDFFITGSWLQGYKRCPANPALNPNQRIKEQKSYQADLLWVLHAGIVKICYNLQHMLHRV